MIPSLCYNNNEKGTLIVNHPRIYGVRVMKRPWEEDIFIPLVKNFTIKDLLTIYIIDFYEKWKWLDRQFKMSAIFAVKKYP